MEKPAGFLVFQIARWPAAGAEIDGRSELISPDREFRCNKPRCHPGPVAQPCMQVSTPVFLSSATPPRGGFFEKKEIFFGFMYENVEILYKFGKRNFPKSNNVNKHKTQKVLIKTNHLS